MTASSEPTVGSAATPARSSQAAVRSAFTRFRVMAYIVGVVLIALVGVGMPLKYLADSPGVVSTIGPFHGLLYMIYLALTLDLATRCRFPTRRTFLIMLAGTIPFVSFVAERKVASIISNEQARAHDADGSVA